VTGTTGKVSWSNVVLTEKYRKGVKGPTNMEEFRNSAGHDPVSTSRNQLESELTTLPKSGGKIKDANSL
jgi:hypothetical protein